LEIHFIPGRFSFVMKQFIKNNVNVKKTTLTSCMQGKRYISRAPSLVPSKFPSKPEIFHQEALEKALSQHVAEGKKHVDLETLNIKPVVAPQAWVINLQNEKTEIINLDPYFFDCPPRKDILHRMVVWQLAKRRQGTHKNKYRLETAYTKKKMYQQKHTGYTRHKDRGAPQFRGGGRALPKRPRSYYFKLNRRVRFLALRMALTAKYLQGRLQIVDRVSIERPKTKIAFQLFKNLGVVDGNSTGYVIDGLRVNKEFERASWNLSYVCYVSVKALNVYDLLRFDKVFITKRSLDIIAGRWSRYRLQ